MQPVPFKIFALSCAVCALAACSRGAAPAQTGSAPDPAAAPAAQPAGDAASATAIDNPCDVITAADVAGIFTVPAKALDTAAITPEYKNCQYTTPGAHVDVVVSQMDPGNDMPWRTATTYSHVDVPLTGIGDLAMRNADGTILAARKGDTYCRIEVTGYDSPDNTVTTDRGEALAKKLGALCNKLFASH